MYSHLKNAQTLNTALVEYHMDSLTRAQKAMRDTVLRIVEAVDAVEQPDVDKMLESDEIGDYASALLHELRYSQIALESIQSSFARLREIHAKDC